jgi:uncharacterized protein YkwD
MRSKRTANTKTTLAEHLGAGVLVVALLALVGLLPPSVRMRPPAAAPEAGRERVTSPIDPDRPLIELTSWAARALSMERVTSGLPSVAGVTSEPANAGPAPADPGAPPAVASLTPVESALFALTNADRAAAGLPALELDVEILAIARARAAQQVPLPELSHYDAAGTLVFEQLLLQRGAAYSLAGENLVRVRGPEDAAAEGAEQGMMGSPPHRQNILEPAFDHLAVGAAVDSTSRVVFAQIFRALSG